MTATVYGSDGVETQATPTHSHHVVAIDFGVPTKLGLGFDLSALAQKTAGDFRFDHRFVANDGVRGIVFFFKLFTKNPAP